MRSHDESILLTLDDPWPGLRSFSEEGRAFFNGREDERDELFRLVKHKMLTLLDGQPGLGKTSLLQAGLFPLLRQHHFLPVYLRLDHSPHAPSLVDQMKDKLLEVCRSEGVTVPPVNADDALWELLHRARLVDGAPVAYGFTDATGRQLRPVIVLDQFEELVTLGAQAPERVDAFVEELGKLVRNDVPRRLAQRLLAHPEQVVQYDFEYDGYRVLLSAREDYIAALNHRLRDSTGNITTDSMRLQPFSGAQAYNALLATASHLLTTSVARRIVQVVAGEKDAEVLEELVVAPAILSVFCRQLNQQRKRLNQQQIGAQLLMETESGILADFYRDSMQDVSDAVRTFVEDELLTASGDHRTSRPTEDIRELPGGEHGLGKLLELRLLTEQHRFGTWHVELTHDVLVDVVKESRAHRRLLEAEAAERAREESERARAQMEREAQHRREAEEQQRRLQGERQRRKRAVAALVVVALVASGFGVVKEQQSETARSLMLAADSARDKALAAEKQTAAMLDSTRLAHQRADSLLQVAEEEKQKAVAAAQRAEAARGAAEEARLIAMLEAETSDDFKRQSAELRRRRAAVDSVSAVMAARADQLQGEATAARAALLSRARFTQSAVCLALAEHNRHRQSGSLVRDTDSGARGAAPTSAEPELTRSLLTLRDSAAVWLDSDVPRECR